MPTRNQTYQHPTHIPSILRRDHMVSLDDAIIAHYDFNNERFEILVDPDMAYEFRESGEWNKDILAEETIFTDSHKGDRAKTEDLEKTFGTVDPVEIARIILKKGDIQLTTDHKREIRTKKRKKIVSTIARNAINPQTNTPHPPNRISSAMEEVNFHVDISKSIEEQVKEVLKKIRPLLPIRFEKTEIAIKLSGEDYGKCYGDIVAFGEIKRQEWQKDGSWVGVVEIPAGVRMDLMDRLNSKTKGNVEMKILKHISGTS
jgi:ribosome maturation protein SDO1